MTLQKLRDLLKTIGPPVYHYNSEDKKEKADKYIIWAEDGEGDSLLADGKQAEQVIQGTIDYFTKTEYDPVVQQIQEKLDSSDDIAWYLNSVQKEKDTGYIHYEWVFELGVT